ncbi:hypothetical protein ACQKWADRAFT_9704 [Trichoderma austrokoningii]
MGRKPTPQPLILADASALDADPPQRSAEAASQAAAASPVDSKSPRSQRISPFPISKFAVHRNRTGRSPAALQPQPPRPATSTGPPDEASRSYHQQQLLQLCRAQNARDDSDLLQPSPSTASTPDPHPPSAAQDLRQAMTGGSTKQQHSKPSFFQFNKAPKTPSQPHHAHAHQHTESQSLSLPKATEGGERPGHNKDPINVENSHQKSISSYPSRSDLSASSSGDAEAPPPLPSSARKNKSKSFALLGRSKSVRDKENGRHKPPPAQVAAPLPAASSNPPPLDNTNTLTSANSATTAVGQAATAPQDRAPKDDGMNPHGRGRTEDRTAGAAAAKDGPRDKEHRAHSSSIRETGASTFLSGLRYSSTRAADIISKGLFGKSSRSGSTTEKEPVVDDDHYVLKVINLPLVEQTRLTRISKRLEDSRDKTEFWMPAFPWRAIDYLNFKGTEVEGLYRVPGSGPQVKKWQRKFDEQHDVNLFDQDDLYDINIVGSMLKAWLRELPDELFPKAAQDRIARECQGAEKVPKLLIDELSKLSPFNYYLLFAITCHLSLLLAHSDKNKMDFRNLCICFQPCMKIDAFCFKFLVCDWRDCWKGCINETKFIEEEYRIFDQPPPSGLAEMQTPSRSDAGHAEKPASSHSNKASSQETGGPTEDAGKHQNQSSKSNHSLSSRRSSISTALSDHSEDEDEDEEEDNVSDMFGFTHSQATAGAGSRELRPLSPIQPLSPLGF